MWSKVWWSVDPNSAQIPNVNSAWVTRKYIRFQVLKSEQRERAKQHSLCRDNQPSSWRTQKTPHDLCQQLNNKDSCHHKECWHCNIKHAGSVYSAALCVSALSSGEANFAISRCWIWHPPGGIAGPEWGAEGTINQDKCTGVYNDLSGAHWMRPAGWWTHFLILQLKNKCTLAHLIQQSPGIGTLGGVSELDSADSWKISKHNAILY